MHFLPVGHMNIVLDNYWQVKGMVNMSHMIPLQELPFAIADWIWYSAGE